MRIFCCFYIFIKNVSEMYIKNVPFLSFTVNITMPLQMIQILLSLFICVLFLSIQAVCTGENMSPVTRTHPEGYMWQTGRHPALALKVSRAGAPLQLVPVWLCRKHYDFITPKRRESKRKKNSLHSSVNVHLKLQLDQSLARINKERLDRFRGWLDLEMEGGSEDVCWKTEE